MKKVHTIHYRAYLIRFWQENEGDPWRGMVENPHTGQHHGFASLDQMLSFLKAQTEPSKPPDEPTRPPKQP